MAFYDIDTTENDWQNYSASYERNQRSIEARDLCDWQTDDIASRNQVREEAANSMLPVLCDGSGICEEIFEDVDFARVIPCATRDPLYQERVA